VSRPGQGDGCRHRSGAADEQLGAGADEGRLGSPEAEAEARREEIAERAEQGRRIVRGGRLDGELAGEDHLVEIPGGDPIDGG
jgi:hypothetical protein